MIQPIQEAEGHMRRLMATGLIALLLAPATGVAQMLSEFESVGLNPAGLKARTTTRTGLVRAELVPMAALPSQQTPARRHWVARHPVLVGTLAGAGVGLAWLANEGCSSSDYTCGGLVTFFAGLGAGLGAGAGAIVGLFLP
jgi:hypothetical protein